MNRGIISSLPIAVRLQDVAYLLGLESTRRRAGRVGAALEGRSSLLESRVRKIWNKFRSGAAGVAPVGDAAESDKVARQRGSCAKHRGEKLARPSRRQD